ncbi:multiple epidermal growth factor-like domains protein 6 [Osmerus eperlanus]|uniref:multiple epidermal growth factor-like domains protein 6 n=1 Tax=Osmerus eperlanus TaxID=29151 RepID=UPI002E111832
MEDCQPCPPALYCPLAGLSDPSGPCDPGFYCPGGQSSPTPRQHACPVGHYWLTSPSGPCAAGFLCLGGASQSSPSDNTTGTVCPPGSYCPVGSSAPTPCPKGTFSNQNGLWEASQCRSCSPGFYCAEQGLLTGTGPCLPGFYCLEGSQSAAPEPGLSGGLCPSGHYCERGTSVPVPCPAGTQRNQTGGTSTDDCTPCPEGWFQEVAGQRECLPCPPGLHCQTHTTRGSPSGATGPQPCPEGYICPGEGPTSQPLPCPRGTYSPAQGLTTPGECLPCPAGHFCGSEGLVQPTGPCTAGYLCVTGATVPNPTDNRTGSPCPPGWFCLLGLRAGDCWAGFYCDHGSSRPDQTLCPTGSYCPGGSPLPLLCPAGTYSPRAGNTHLDNCSSCPAGRYCRGQGVVQPETCPVGHYCPTGLTLGTEFPCPPGTLQAVPGASSPGDCLPCPAGQFCSLPGLSQASGPCQAGYYCPPGASSPNTTGYQGNSSTTAFCPPGHYCPPGAGSPLHCPPGSLSPSPALQRQEDCPPCPAGRFCSAPALVLPSDTAQCDAGYVCLGGSPTPRPGDGLHGYPCPAGHSCPVGTAKETPCEPGTYSPSPGSAHCLTCPNGTMCPFLATQNPLLCPSGHFCPAGSSLPLACPPGSLSNQTGAWSASVCRACPSGVYCSSPGATAPQGPCQHGYFCQGGASEPTPFRSDSLPGNGPCPLGHYCPEGCLSPKPCPPGSVRNSTGGVSLEGCLSCPPGWYCAREGLSSPSGLCAAGFYCPYDFSSTTPYAVLCPKGHYCPAGSPLALACPTGEYQPNPGSELCVPCRPGFYCEEAVVGDPRPCPPHAFCPAGTMVPQPCPNGTFTPPGQGGLQEERECLSCPPGSYCRQGHTEEEEFDFSYHLLTDPLAP